MKLLKHPLMTRSVYTVLFGAALAACGGGGDAADATSSSMSLSSNEMSATSLATSTYIPNSRGTTTVTPTNTASTAAVPAITTVQLTNTTASSQSNAAATFGQVFAQGDVRTGETLVGRNANGVTVPLQVDVKARHADGSLRHAVITARLPSAAANGVETVSLIKSATPVAATQTTPASLLNSGFTASFTATIAGVRYTASADTMLKSGKYTTWLSGPLVNEWLVSVPLKNASGVEHPHLVAQFAIRSYTGSNSARVDVTVENGWAFQSSPQNIMYDAQMLVGGQSVYSQAGLNHYHHARWRKIFWWGNASVLNVRHDTKYLIASKALPNYDQSLVIKDATIASWQTRWNASQKAPMQPGVAQPYMPTTGGRADIGLMPAWNALYLLSMDQRMKDVALGMSEVAGAWSTHYRDKNTGRPVTLAEYPYMSAITNYDTTNPVTKKSEAFPACPAAVCTSAVRPDTAHQPDFAYVPYLVTGDYYHLEELQFWANYSSFSSNPLYREAGKGLVKSLQVRGQAWTLRTLTEAAYITPDNDVQKANLVSMVNNNIEWYTETYPNNPAANKLGVINNGHALEYSNGTALAPWQDDFFTQVVGRAVELGFSNAQPLLAWKTKFVVDRMTGTGFCWIQAPAYNLTVTSSSTAPLYTSIGEVYQASFATTFTQLSCASSAMATNLKLRTAETVGYMSTDGAQAIMQPGLAYAVGAHPNGAKAWSLFAARPFKPDFATGPQFAIVPR
jgi:hypothetical protein